MSDFLKSQLDYIFFFYGAAFFLLVPVCLFLRQRPNCRLAWIWLGWFGATHGTNEWLDLLDLSFGLGPLFHFARIGLLIISFVCLAEFGRISLATLRGHGPGRWVLAGMVGLAALGGLAGLAGLNAATRYALGLLGGLWAATALFLAARNLPQGSRQLQAAALGMFGYALAAGLAPNTAPFFPASWCNYDSFLAVTGIPIQLIRGLLAVWVSASLGLFAQACLAEERNHRLRIWFRKLMRGALAGVTLLMLGGWCITQYFGVTATREKRDDYLPEVEMLRQVMLEKAAEGDRFVKLLSGWPTILQVLVGQNLQTMEQANDILDRFSQMLPGSICYVMDLHGQTIASSNRHHPDSFVGASYAFRPYFQQAILGSSGRYWGLGVTSRKIGYYASFPVRNNVGQIVGVAVIKRPLGDIETVIYGNYISLVIDRHGIVVMANRSDMVLKSLWPLTAPVQEEMFASRQFGDGPFTPILTKEPADGGECLIQGNRMMVLRRPLPWEDWSIVVLGSIWPIAQARLLGISITLVLSLLFIGFLTIIVIMREGEERFRQLFENAADTLILYDRERIIEVNQQACRSLGYLREELLKMSLFDIEVGLNKDFFIDRWEAEGGTITFSGLHRRRNGSIFPAEIRVAAVTLRGQNLRLAAIRDISERQKAEEALKAERQRLFNLLDGLQAYIFLRRQNYSLVYVNQYFRERFGDPANLPCYGILHGSQEPCEVCPSQTIFETGSPQEWEWTSRSGRTYRIYDYPFADVDNSPLVLEMGIDITQRKRAEEALRSSEEALRQSQESYRSLAGHLLSAQEAERKRLARELHDDLSQRLAVLAMEAEMLERQMRPAKGAGAVRLKEMKDKLVELAIDVHAISRRLHPSILDDLGLPDAIASECSRFRKQDGMVLNYLAENISRDVPPDVAVCLYRIVQEGLRNISRHAGATEVTISLVGKDDAIYLSIMDNGRGFDPDRVKKKEGLGLDSMKERAYLIGGDFALLSQPGQGTVIEVLVPLSRSKA